MPPFAVQPAHHGWDLGESHEALNSNSEPVRSPVHIRSVSFHDKVNFREIPSIAELTPDEIGSVWYNDDEYAKIKKTVSDTIKRNAKGEKMDESKGTCMRGLEGRTKFGARRRKKNKAAALDAVWSTQVKMWKKRTENPAAIATIYKELSIRAKYFAIETAYNDECYVQMQVRNE